MRKADRLFQLVSLARVHQPITAHDLRHLGISVRSVYRYTDDLSLSEIPIYREAGVGYRLDHNFELPPLNLTAAELEPLFLGIEMVSKSTGETLPIAANSLLCKISASLPAHTLQRHKPSVHALNLMDRTVSTPGYGMCCMMPFRRVAP